MARPSLAQRVRRIVSSFKSDAGETLVETLISTLIVSAVVLMLSTAVVTAAGINAKADQVDASFDEADAMTPDDADQYELKVGDETVSLSGTNQQAQLFEQNGYVFYQYAKGE